MSRSEGPHLFLARRSVDGSRRLSCSRRFVGNLKDCIAEEKRTILGKEKKRTTSSHHDSPERGTKRGLSLLYRYSACYLPTYFHALYYRITNFLDSHFPAWRSCGARCVANLFCNLSVPETMGRLSALALTTYVQLKRRQLNLCRKRATRCKTSTSALLSFSHKRSRPRAQVSSQASNPLASCLPLAQGRCR
jgi:hypothetical protein